MEGIQCLERRIYERPLTSEPFFCLLFLDLERFCRCGFLLRTNLLLFRLTLRNLLKQKVSPVFRKLVTSLLKQKMKCKQYSFHGNRLNRFQKLWKSTKIARKYGKNKVILIILRLKFLKTRAPCAIGTSLPELQFFSQKNICDKIDFHIARQTWWCKQPLCMLV